MIQLTRDYEAHLRLSGLAESTLRNSVALVRRLGTDFAGEDADLVDTQRCTIWCYGTPDDNYSRSYIVKRRNALRGLFDYAVEIGRLHDNPANAVRIPRDYADKTPRAFTKAEAQRIVEAIHTHRERIMILLQLNDALRPIEVSRAIWADWDGSQLQVRGKGNNGHVSRTIWVAPGTAKAIERWRSMHGVFTDPSDAIVQQSDGRGLTSQTVQHCCRLVLSRAGIPANTKKTVYGLRHTALTDYLEESGGDIHETSRLAGHTARHTERYVNGRRSHQQRIQNERRSYC